MNSKTIKIFTFICFVIISSTSLCLAGQPFFPKLVVTGSAVLHKPADQFGLSISVVSQAETAEKALSDNNERTDVVINSLKLVGLEKGEYFTGQFAIHPVYSQPPRNIPPDWRATIIGYEVTNSVTIKTQKLDLAPYVIDAAGQSGATQIANISFGISDTDIYRTEVIKQATANALRDAEALADAANIDLVRILDINLSHPQIYQRAGHNMMYMAKAEAATFIEAPDVDINATVSVTFEIASKS